MSEHSSARRQKCAADATRPESTPWLGFILGALCALIWGIQAVVSRQSVLDGLTTGDVAVLRFATSGLLLVPVALLGRRRFPLRQLGWGRALVLCTLAGAPYSLVLVGGVAFAPALHSAVVAPGLVPLVAAGLAFLFLNEQPAPSQLAGLVLVAMGLVMFSWDALLGTPAREGTWRGDLLFVMAAAMWALFGVLLKRWSVDPVGATVTICVLSLFTLPVWAGFLPLHLATARPLAIALQALYQGVLVGVVSLFLYAHAVKRLGAVRAATFLSLVPGVTALAGSTLLGEIPSLLEMVGTAVVMAGMGLALRLNSRQAD